MMLFTIITIISVIGTQAAVPHRPYKFYKATTGPSDQNRGFKEIGVERKLNTHEAYGTVNHYSQYDNGAGYANYYNYDDYTVNASPLQKFLDFLNQGLNDNPFFGDIDRQFGGIPPIFLAVMAVATVAAVGVAAQPGLLNDIVDPLNNLLNPTTTAAPSAAAVSYVAGGWTAWGDWGACDAKSMRTRTRTCTNPAPSSKGPTCIGLAEAVEACPAVGVVKSSVVISGGAGKRRKRRSITLIDFATIQGTFESAIAATYQYPVKFVQASRDPATVTLINLIFTVTNVGQQTTLLAKMATDQTAALNTALVGNAISESLLKVTAINPATTEIIPDTCSNGDKDGDEETTDCGGSCGTANCDPCNGITCTGTTPVCVSTTITQDSCSCSAAQTVESGDDILDSCAGDALNPGCGTDGKCMCKAGEICDSQSSDQCKSGVCQCGDKTACSGTTPICKSGACTKCESNSDCPALNPRCDSDGSCKCGTSSDCGSGENGNSCSGTGETAICQCGVGVACTAGSQVPKCLNGDPIPTFKLGDEDSTCKCSENTCVEGTAVTGQTEDGTCGTTVGVDLGKCVGCTVDGKSGDGTARGTCPIDNFCQKDGKCTKCTAAAAKDAKLPHIGCTDLNPICDASGSDPVCLCDPTTSQTVTCDANTAKHTLCTVSGGTADPVPTTGKCVVCNVAGAVGDGTAQGTCDASNFCQDDGKCTKCTAKAAADAKLPHVGCTELNPICDASGSDPVCLCDPTAGQTLTCNEKTATVCTVNGDNAEPVPTLGTCNCGGISACTTGSTIPECLLPDTAGAPTIGDETTAICQCTDGASDAKDTCQIGTTPDATAPFCCTTTALAGSGCATVGACSGCRLEEDGTGAASAIEASSPACPSGTCAASTCPATAGCCKAGQCHTHVDATPNCPA